MPKRIQMTRTRLWRPDNPGAVIVARPSKWGNPYKVGEHPHGDRRRKPYTPETAVAEYRRREARGAAFSAMVARELRGKDLACWCALDQPCHADVLLEIANRPLAAVD